jgi:hypothetical protein
VAVFDFPNNTAGGAIKSIETPLMANAAGWRRCA